MLGRIILLLLQIAGGYFITPLLFSQIPVPGALSLYLYAVIVAVVIYLIGLLAAQVVKDVAMPSPATLSSAVIVALIAAALWSFGPELLPQLPWSKVPSRWAVLGGAILGYLAKR
ncbi:MAG: hypothetical protein NW216_14940 [Hyphomicrobium sp.]|nr:hypothetical protein [Hyphomicrobium sp.]